MAPLQTRLPNAILRRRSDVRVGGLSVKASREKERQRILQMASENRKIAQRIETRQSTINNNRDAGASGSSGGQPKRRPPAPVRPAPAAADDRPPWKDD